MPKLTYNPGRSSGGGGGGSGDLLSTLANNPVAITGAGALASFDTLYVCSGSANYTVTLPSPTSNAGKLLAVRIAPTATGLVTVAEHASETIDGAASRLMWAGESAILLTDGTNWFKIGGKTVPMTTSLNRSSTTFTCSSQSGNNVVIPMDTQLSGPATMFNGTDGTAMIRRAGLYSCMTFIFGHGFANNETQVLGISQNGTLNLFKFSGSNASGFFADSYSALIACAAGDELANIIQPADNNSLTFGAGSSTNAPQLVVAEIPGW